MTDHIPLAGRRGIGDFNGTAPTILPGSIRRTSGIDIWKLRTASGPGAPTPARIRRAINRRLRRLQRRRHQRCPLVQPNHGRCRYLEHSRRPMGRQRRRRHPSGGLTPALAGDFNGDGTSDIAWYNTSNGGVESGSLRTASGPAASMSARIRLGWQPLGAADFNVDGTSDIAWYNPSTNNIDIWLIRRASGREASISARTPRARLRSASATSTTTASATSCRATRRATASTTGCWRRADRYRAS